MHTGKTLIFVMTLGIAESLVRIQVELRQRLGAQCLRRFFVHCIAESWGDFWFLCKRIDLF